jgi:phosphoribosylamine--glycine ligase
MNILVVGSGGREHALCWRLARSPLVKELYCAPGNPGTARCGVNVPISPGDIEQLAAFGAEKHIDLTVCGPEAPLCAGIRDRFSSQGLLLAGPTAAGAQLEGSKAFAKQFMARHGIPTAAFAVFADEARAAAHIEAHPSARVVKADGLAAGKGVFVCRSADTAKDAVRRILGGEFGGAGRHVLIEDRLEGQEASFMVVTDGERIFPLATSQDHKAVFDGDQGPNTGGMGAYSPAPVISAELEGRIMEEVMQPAVRGMAEEGAVYQGILYAGLMIQPASRTFQVLEFNCRLGDPETQPVMARLESDLVPYLLGAAEGRLPDVPLRWDRGTALCVVMASRGYPGPHESGQAIEGIEEAEGEEGALVFHAGTAMRGGQLVTAGGRVLGVTALGEGPAEAKARAYRAVDRIRWDGTHFRRDIGDRAIPRA